MLSLLDDTVTGGVGIPFTERLLNSGRMGGAGNPAKTAGSGTGIPAKTAGSGLNWKVSGEGIVNMGTFPAGVVFLGIAPVPKNGAASLVIEGGM